MHQLTKSMNKEDMNGNDLQTVITHGLNQIKEKMGPNFDIRKVNLAEMQRITGVFRAKLRHLKKNNFVVSPHGRTGQKAVYSDREDQSSRSISPSLTDG